MTPTSTSARVGVLGLGNMGLPIALNLLSAGHTVTGWDLAPRDLPEPGEVVDDLASVGRTCPVVLCLLPELEMLLPLLDEDGLLPDDAVVTHLVVMSTCSPVGVRELSEKLAPRGVTLVDAPMSGGVMGARDARLSIMVGAEPEAFEVARPVLESVGTTVRLMGPVGAGSVTKACNQMVVAATVVGLAEAALIAERNDLDRGLVLDVLAGGLAASEVLVQKRHALVEDDFAPTGPARFMIKDLRFADEAAAGAHLPLRDVTAALYASLTEEGMGDEDNAVVLEYLRRHACEA